MLEDFYEINHDNRRQHLQIATNHIDRQPATDFSVLIVNRVPAKFMAARAGKQPGLGEVTTRYCQVQPDSV